MNLEYKELYMKNLADMQDLMEKTYKAIRTEATKRVIGGHTSKYDTLLQALKCISEGRTISDYSMYRCLDLLVGYDLPSTRQIGAFFESLHDSIQEKRRERKNRKTYRPPGFDPDTYPEERLWPLSPEQYTQWANRTWRRKGSPLSHLKGVSGVVLGRGEVRKNSRIIINKKLSFYVFKNENGRIQIHIENPGR